MAAHMVSIARREYNADWSYADADATAAASSSSSSSTWSQSRQQDDGRELEAAPLRSGVATMEPNEGGCGARSSLWV